MCFVKLVLCAVDPVVIKYRFHRCFLRKNGTQLAELRCVQACVEPPTNAHARCALKYLKINLKLQYYQCKAESRFNRLGSRENDTVVALDMFFGPHFIYLILPALEMKEREMTSVSFHITTDYEYRLINI